MTKNYILSLFVLLTTFVVANAQLTGTKNIPGNYATLAAAISDLNLQGVGAGGVTLNLLAGNPQTAPAGGYIIGDVGSLVLTSASVTNQVTITGNGNTITASAALTVGNINDGIFKLIGADWIKIQGFVMQENAANTVTTPAASNNMTEWGVALLYVTVTDGAQNNTIQNNTISLNRTYSNSFGIYSNVRHTALDVLTVADITDPTTGPNLNTKIYNNNINNVNAGIALIGSATAANMDTGADIGGGSLATGNTFTNWGGVAPLSMYVSNAAASYCIFTNHEVGVNVSFNTLTSSPLINFSGTLLGIYVEYGTTAPVGTFTNNLNSNTVTLTNAFASTVTATQIHVIRHSAAVAGSPATATVNMNNNTILNCAVTGLASSITLFGVLNTAAFGVANLNSNIVRGTTSTGATGGIVGVTSQGGVITTLNLNNNKCGDALGNFVTYSAANSGATNGVTVAVAITPTISMSNNDVRGIIYSTASTANPLLISNTYAGSGTANILNNTFTNLNLNTSGSLSFIGHAGNMTLTGVENCNNNSIVGTFNKALAGGTVSFFASNASSVNGSAMTNSGNNFSNVTVTGATTIAGWSNTEGASSASGPTKTITGNIFNNISGGTSGITLIATNFGNSTTCTGNTITNITGQGAITGITHGTSNQQMHSYSSNTISNLISNGTGGTIVGITGGSTTITQMDLNSNIMNNFSSTGASATITGIGVTTSSTIVNVNNNNINTFTGTGITSPLLRGITIAAGLTVNVSKNKIYNLAENGTFTAAVGAVSGMLISGGGTTAPGITLSNNLIGDLRTPASTSTTTNDAIRGINITDVTALASINLYYNTVNINAQSTGANFSTTGIFHTFNTTATSGALNMRNNIIVNNSTAKGTGLTVAFRRSAATNLNNYATTSNNNLFWAGGASACTTRFIYYDGTAGAQLPAFQALVTPRETASITEEPRFISTSGASVNFLHINPAIQTLIESGAVTIAGFADDIDGNIRSVTTPDIGADEFSGIIATACSGAPSAGVASASVSTICNGFSTDICLTGQSAGTGISVRWQSSLVNGGPYTDIPCATANCYNTGALTPGTYYFVAIVTCATGTFTQSNQVTIVVNPTPTAGILPSAPTICNGSSVVLTASGGSTYLWSPAGGLNTTIGAVVTASPSITTTYTVTVTDLVGCTGTASVTVTVNPSPTGLTATATPPSVCVGNNSQLNVGAAIPVYCASTHSSGCSQGDEMTNVVLNTLASPSGCAASAYTYFTPTPTTTLTAGTMYTLSVSFGTDGAQFFGAWIDYDKDGVLAASEFVGGTTVTAGASGTSSIMFTVPAGAFNGTTRLRIVGGNDSQVTSGQACGASSSAFGETEDYDITLTGGVEQYTYLWSPPTFLSSTTISNPVATGVTATTTYTVVVTGLNGCTGTAMVTVTADPTANVTGNTTICAGASTTLTATGGTGYLWSTGAMTPAITVSPLTNTNYSVTVTNNVSGCTAVVSRLVTVNPLPVITLSPAADVTICNGASQTITATAAGSTFLWSTGAVTASINVSPIATTTYSVTATVTATGCTAVASRTVTVNPKPVVTLSPVADVTICSGSSQTITATSAGSTFLWSTGAITAAITVSPIITTTYTVTVTSTTTGCTNTASRTVNVIQGVTLSETHVEPTTCVSLTGSINLTVNTGVGPFTYLWTTPDGAGLTAGVEDQTGLLAGTYFVTVTSVNGCTQTLAVTLGLPGNCFVCPTMGFSLNTNLGGSNVCAGTTFTLTADSLVSMGVTYGIRFVYFPTATATPYVGGTNFVPPALVANGALTGGGTIATATITGGLPIGTYVVYAILNPSPINPLCRPSSRLNLTVNPVPVANPVTNQAFCVGSTVPAISLTSPTAGAFLSWTRTPELIGGALGGGGITPTTIPSFIATNAGTTPLTSTYTVTPSYTAGVTCTGTPINFTLTVNPNPTVNAVVNQYSSDISLYQSKYRRNCNI